MRIPVELCAVLFAMPLLAAERMTVSVCTRGRLDDRVVARAETVAAALYHAVDIDVAWAKCEAGLEGDQAVLEHWFTARFRDGRPFIPSSPDTLGEAYLSDDSKGYILEVYYEEIEMRASARSVEPATLLGYVLAHELAHLLLGPGHAPWGMMRTAWDGGDLHAICQNHLKFSPAEGLRMRRALQSSLLSSLPGTIRRGTNCFP